MYMYIMYMWTAKGYCPNNLDLNGRAIERRFEAYHRRWWVWGIYALATKNKNRMQQEAGLDQKDAKAWSTASRSLQVGAVACDATSGTASGAGPAILYRVPLTSSELVNQWQDKHQL